MAATRQFLGQDRTANNNTVTVWAVTQAAISGSRRCVAPVSSTAKNVAVSGARIVPPIVAAMASSGQNPGWPPDDGRQHRSHRTAHDQQRCKHAAGCTRAQRHRPDDGLHRQQAARHFPNHVPSSSCRCWHTRRRARADRSTRLCRPPDRRSPATTSSEWAASGTVLGGIDHRVSSPDSKPAQRRPDPAPTPRPTTSHAALKRKDRPGQQRHAHDLDNDAATATGMKLRGVHSNSSNSTASMIAAIGVPNTVVMPAAAPATSSVLRSAADRQHLRDQRADGAAGHDDRTFGAEWPAGADRDRRRQWLQHRNLRHRCGCGRAGSLRCLGNAVAADLLASVTGHEADDQRTGDRNEKGREAERRVGNVVSGQREFSEIGDVR